MRQRPDYGNATPEDLARALLRPTNRPPLAFVDDGPKSWSEPITRIFNDAGVRLDADYYKPDPLDGLKYTTSPLSEWAEVRFIRDRGQKVFTPEPVGDAKPYLNATEFQALISFAKTPERFVSRASAVNFDAFLIEADWLLVTRSGTLGRVFYVTSRYAGWFASDDFIRVIPKQQDMAGYLYAWLSHPLARRQILREGYGAQIDHIDDTHLRTIKVPQLKPDAIKRINSTVVRGMKRRDSALKSIGNAWDAE